MVCACDFAICISELIVSSYIAGVLWWWHRHWQKSRAGGHLLQQGALRIHGGPGELPVCYCEVGGEGLV